MNQILTFGYGNRKDYDQFSEYLERYSVEIVVDIRFSPKAWTRKWWRDSLMSFCSSKGISYISLPELGNTSGNAKWIPPRLDEAELAVSSLCKMVKGKSLLLLCAELDYRQCHRTEVAEKISSRIKKSSVIHLS